MQFDKFESVVGYINGRCDGSIEPGSNQDNQETSRYSYNSDLKVAVMNIEGALSYRPITFMGMDCGGANYQTIKDDFEYLVGEGAKTIAFYADSPGGEAYQLFPTAQYLRKVADENGVKILTFVDGLAASAMYGLAAISDRLIVAEGAEVGSIGVVVRLINDSQALEKAGYQRTFIKAGASKVPFEEDGSFREEFIADIQSKVDVLYNEFVNHVAEHRGMSVEAVRNTEAKTFLPEQAIAIGLADEMMSVESFQSYLADFAQSNLEGNEMSNPLKKMFNLNKEEPAMAQLQELQALAETQEALLQSKETELAASLQTIAQLTSSVETLQTNLESLQAFAEEHKAAAEAAQAEAVRLEAEAAQAKVDQRKAAIAAAYTEDQVEATFTALSNLDDASFKLIVDQQLASKEARAESFKAIGNEGVEQEQPTVEQGSLNAIRQAGVENARAKFKPKK